MFIGGLIPIGMTTVRSSSKAWNGITERQRIKRGTKTADYLKRDEKTPVALSASAALQAVRSASKLICVAVKFVASLL
jgi:hypothetical protein